MRALWVGNTILLLSLVSFPSIALAQTTNATCESTSETSWLFNSAGHSPCHVWSRIQSLCLPSTSYINVPPLLDATWAYNLPSGETICQCNAVAYSLMAGCTFCQTGQNGNWADEQDWRDVCGEKYTGDGLGFAESVQVLPLFAWRPWNGGRWSPAEASQSASLYSTATPAGPTTLSRDLPSIPATSAPTGPILSASNTPTRSPSPSSTSDQNPTGESEKSPAEKWGPIVGGIAGGILLLVLIIFLIIRYRSKKQQNTSEPEIVRYNPKSNDNTKTRGTSFFSMFGGSTRDREGAGKRETELMADPLSFAAPRPAPKAPAIIQTPKRPGSNDSLTYVTTQQRLRRQGDDGDYSDDNSEFDAYTPRTVQTPYGRTLIVSNRNPDSDSSLTSPDTPRPTQKGLLKKGPPATPRQDFSQPRPYSEAGTLPSLYEPPTGAPTFRGTMHSGWTGDGMMSRPDTILSPRSHYPATDRGSRVSTIGAALGSGRVPSGADERYWSRQKLPPLPKDGGENAKRKQ